MAQGPSILSDLDPKFMRVSFRWRAGVTIEEQIAYQIQKEVESGKTTDVSERYRELVAKGLEAEDETKATSANS